MKSKTTQATNGGMIVTRGKFHSDNPGHVLTD
jgi:hypothetical protein